MFAFFRHRKKVKKPVRLGSSSLITNFDGEVTQHVEYIPYGEVFIEERNNVWNTPYLFNAKELDEETGLYYYGARYLDPTVAMWISVDPLAEEYPNMSPYVFCNNNPVFFVDLDGLMPTPYPKASLGSVNYYEWRHEDFNRRNPGKKAPDYYLNYGDKYIRRFTDETNYELSSIGKQWLIYARLNLQKAMEIILRQDGDIELYEEGNAFRRLAFESHVDAYWNAGLYNVTTVDLFAIVLTPDFKDLLSEDGLNQAARIMSMLVGYWIENPNVAVQRIKEFNENRDKIRSMFEEKAKKEGISVENAEAKFNQFYEECKKKCKEIKQYLGISE